MITKTQHTPVPWEISEHKYGLEIVSGKQDVEQVVNFNAPSAIQKVNAEFIVLAVNDHETLLEFAKRHHEVCEDCEGTGKMYKHADPTTGQWIPCPVALILGLDGARP